MNLIFDIGGTHTRAAVSSDGVEFFGEPIVEKTPQSFTDGVALIVNLASRLAGGEKLAGASGGIAGSIKSATGELAISSNLPDWSNKNIKQELSQKLGVEVLLENDAVLAGIGEATRGAGKGFEVVAYITVSTGVGGARIIRGVPDRGVYSFEPGHQIIDGGKTLEELIGGAALEKRFGKKPEDIDDASVWNDVAQKLAVGIHNIIVHWSPDAVIVGGALMHKISLELVEKHLSEIHSIYPILPTLRRAALGDRAGLIGALERLRLDSMHR